jgi:hypothetical protein
MPELTQEQKIAIWPSLALGEVDEHRARQWSSISSNPLNDVLNGENVAAPLLTASSEGDDSQLQTLLQDPHWIKIALQRQKYIRTEMRPAKDADDKRAVSTIEWDNLERAVFAATQNGHASTVSLLTTTFERYRTGPARFESRDTMKLAIEQNHVNIVEALVHAHPAVMIYTVDHKNTPLDYAIRKQKPEIVAALLSLATAHPNLRIDYTASQRLPLAAAGSNANILKMILETGKYSVPRSGAIQAAVSSPSPYLHSLEEIDEKVKLMVQYGADVNELRSKENCPNFEKELHVSSTPLHYAARAGREDVVELLEGLGAKGDVRDCNGKTAREVLEERKAARLEAETPMGS